MERLTFLCFYLSFRRIFALVKKAIALLAFTILLRPVFPVMSYVIDYDYIANVLCINKDKPELECNGKCHLMKELAKASESEKPATEKKSNIEKTDWIPFDASIVFITPDFIFFARNDIEYKNLYANLQAVSVFHPPAVIS